MTRLADRARSEPSVGGNPGAQQRARGQRGSPFLVFPLGMALILGCGGSVEPLEQGPVVAKPSDLSAPVASLPDGSATRPARARRVSQSGDWFREVPASESGITFRHFSGNAPERPFPAANGSGLATFDFDRDGRCDLFFATGDKIPVPTDGTGLMTGNRLYRGDANWRFQDVTAQARLKHLGYHAGVAEGDWDNDGFPDLYVTCYGRNACFRNLGDGTFEEVGTEMGLADELWGTSAAFADVDDDGLLDVYVCNYGVWSPAINQYCGDGPKQVRMFCSPTALEPVPDLLFRNQGTGVFEDISVSSGISARKLRGQGVVAADVDGDGRVDLYVGNDLHPNSLFVNLGGGKFQDVSEESGTAYDSRGQAQAGMGVEVADFNQDGRFDIFCTNFQNENNSLYENSDAHFFREVSAARGLAADSLPWVGWGTAAADFNLDGQLDVIVTNGHVDNNRHLIGQEAPFEQPGLLWAGTGSVFKLVGAEAGDYFSVDHVGRALAAADIDRDGDLDVVIGHQDAPPSLLRNQADQRIAANRRWSCRFVGTASNRDAVGCQVTWRAGDQTRYFQIKGGGSYLTASQRIVLGVLPETRDRMTLEIRWPSGTRQTLADLPGGADYLIVEGLPQPITRPLQGDETP